MCLLSPGFSLVAMLNYNRNRLMLATCGDIGMSLVWLNQTVSHILASVRKESGDMSTPNPY